MYYLNSRYYDQNTCRFINADAVGVITATPMGLTDKNLFAYCDNNPVMRIDYDGEFWNIVIGAVVGAAVGTISSIVAQYLDEEGADILSSEFLLHVAVSAGVGLISGALAASGAGLAAQVAVNAILGAVGAAVDTTISIDENTTVITYILNIAEGAAIGALSGWLGGAGGASKHVSNHFRRFVKGGSSFRYYYSQIRFQSFKDGLKTIPSILKAAIPISTKTAIKTMIQRED